MCSGRSTALKGAVGFPIRISTDQSLVGSSPWLIAATHVLHRLQAPRHPPLALCSLENKDARARYGVLKGRRTTASNALIRRRLVGQIRPPSREAGRRLGGVARGRARGATSQQRKHTRCSLKTEQR